MKINVNAVILMNALRTVLIAMLIRHVLTNLNQVITVRIVMLLKGSWRVNIG